MPHSPFAILGGERALMLVTAATPGEGPEDAAWGDTWMGKGCPSRTVCLHCYCLTFGEESDYGRSGAGGPPGLGPKWGQLTGECWTQQRMGHSRGPPFRTHELGGNFRPVAYAVEWGEWALRDRCEAGPAQGGPGAAEAPRQPSWKGRHGAPGRAWEEALYSRQEAVSVPRVCSQAEGVLLGVGGPVATAWGPVSAAQRRAYRLCDSSRTASSHASGLSLR